MTLPEWVLQVSALLGMAVLLGVLARRVNLQFNVVLAVVGFPAGWIGGPLGIESPLRGEEFEQVLVFLFLPVLVFAADLGLSTRAFFRNLVPILVLAIPALAVSAVLVGLALRFGLGTPFAAALLFGVLISARGPRRETRRLLARESVVRLLSAHAGASMQSPGFLVYSDHRAGGRHCSLSADLQGP